MNTPTIAPSHLEFVMSTDNVVVSLLHIGEQSATLVQGGRVTSVSHWQALTLINQAQRLGMTIDASTDLD